MIARSRKIIQTLSYAAFVTGTVGLALFLAHALVSDLARTFVIVGIIIGAVFIALKPKFGLVMVLLLPVLGEFGRLPIGPENGVLVSDIFIPIFLVIWLGKKIWKSSDKKVALFARDTTKLWLPFLLFTIVGTFSLVQALLFLSAQEVFSSSLYLVRYVQYALLYLVTFETISNEKEAQGLTNIMIWSAVLISIGGFIQLAIYPDLADLEEAGWDPHINRLVGTWLDPNFVGGFLAMIMTLMLGLMTHEQKWGRKIGYIILLAVLGAALFLTYSRSAYLAFAVGLTIVSLFKSKKILVIGLALFLLAISVSDRAAERVGELGRSVTSIFTTSSATPDPTARLRIKSWDQSFDLFLKRPLFGNGYNTLRYVNYHEGFVANTTIHSASGSDASLLTILATTGLAGFIPFLFLQFGIIKTSLKNFFNKKIDPYWRGYSLGMFGALMALLVHSIFVNSLLFPQILSFLWPQVGILIWIAAHSTSDRFHT